MPLPHEEKRISRSSMRDEVYHHLLGWIVEGVLKPGEKIVDKDLADHMGVSRTPVREALRRLEDKDLVESSANRWTRISEIPEDEPDMVYPIIRTLEKLALSLAMPRLRQKDYSRMKTANERFSAALTQGDTAAALRADGEFHNVYIEGSGNVLLIRILSDLKIRSRRLEMNYFTGMSQDTSSVEEHNALVDALAAGDTALAEQMVEKNWKKNFFRLSSIKKENS